MDSSRRTLGCFLSATFLAVEVEALRELGVSNGNAALSFQIRSFGAKRLATEAVLAVERRVSAVRRAAGDTLAIFEGVTRLAMLFSNANALASLPEEIDGALGSFNAFAAPVGKYLASGTARSTVNTESILEHGVGGTLRNTACKTQFITGNRSRSAMRN